MSIKSLYFWIFSLRSSFAKSLISDSMVASSSFWFNSLLPGVSSFEYGKFLILSFALIIACLTFSKASFWFLKVLSLALLALITLALRIFLLRPLLDG
ncbi:hypothetical protein [Mycoplasmopsis cynos]|uniref:hypothetical protein n=1 Tax=Mycoplasmopsis cynos TaxID=171284 RepID=UPI00220D4AF2|nr:hypothetical protein [Mycoplasmopsis cynos]UWV77714.1 hypothetical protein NW070_02230 [Mycoplasmopsis cynos]